MKYIITEEQDLKLRLLRRIHAIDDMIVPSCERVNKWNYDICRHGFDVYIRSVTSNIIEDMYYDYFGDLDDDSDEWFTLSDMMREYVNSHHKTIKKYYDKKCKDEYEIRYY